ncbi:MAG: SRPBCC family protein [Solirubrobacterales bacterium]
MSGAVRIEVERRFPISVREGFDYITDPANWPEYWPRFVRLDAASRWRTPGDRATLTLRMLGREVELEMTLVRITPYRVVEYTSEQRGLPAARHWRHFV